MSDIILDLRKNEWIQSIDKRPFLLYNKNNLWSVKKFMDNEKDKNEFFSSDDAEKEVNGFPFGADDDDDEPVEGSISGGADDADGLSDTAEYLAALARAESERKETDDTVSAPLSATESAAEPSSEDTEETKTETDTEAEDDTEKETETEKAENNAKKSSISSDLIRGHINTIILRTLYEGDRYGYDIINEIEHKSHGQYTLKQPTLYSALKRLESQGYVKSYWGGVSNGGRRRYFSLTEAGREIAEQNQAEWEYSRTIIDSLISQNDFDFSNPAPEKLDFRILRQATSRTPIVGEEPTEEYAPLIMSAKDGFSPAGPIYADNAASQTEQTTTQTTQTNQKTEQIITQTVTQTAEQAVTQTAAQPTLTAPVMNADDKETTAVADASALRQNEPMGANAQEFSAQAAQSADPSLKPASEQPSQAQQTEQTVQPIQQETARPTEQSDAVSGNSSPIPPLYITRTEEEKNYKDIVSRIYRTSIRHRELPAEESVSPAETEEAVAEERIPVQEEPVPPAAPPVQPMQNQPFDDEPAVTYSEQSYESARPLTPGRIDFQDVEEMARYDGLRVWTAGNASQKREMPENFFNKGLALLRASLIFFAFAITETVLAAVFREDLQLEPWYLITMLVCAAVPPVVCMILYLAKFDPCCKRLKNNTSVYNGIVAFIATFILLIAVDLIFDVNLTDPVAVVAFIVIPLVYLLNIIIFAVAYYFLSRSKV